LIYNSPGLGAATTSNSSAVSRPSSGNVGAAKDVRPTSDKSSGLSDSSIPQPKENIQQNSSSEDERTAKNLTGLYESDIEEAVENEAYGIESRIHKHFIQSYLNAF
jgi:hypothetical protein